MPGPLRLRQMAVPDPGVSALVDGSVAAGSFRVQVRGWVGERRAAREAAGRPSCGGCTSENAGMISERKKIRKMKENC